MTDSLESKLQFEIALYGAKGCPISDLWSVLVREQNITVKQAQANELWKKLVTSKDFEFIKEPEKKKLVEMMNVSYNTVLQEYGSTLHIVMVQEARRKTLTPSSAKKTLAPNHFLALERIIDAGRQGITQAQLARDIGTNAAGIYESVKKLEKLELITRHRSSYPGGYTNICYYTRYSPRNEAEQDATAVSTKGSIPYDLALSKVLKMLENAQDNILPLREVVHRLHEENQYGKKWIRGICDMGEKRGYVQKVKVISGNEQQRCLKLLKTLSQADEAATSSSSAEFASEQRSNATDMHPQAESTDNAAAEGAAVTNSSQIEKGIVIPAHMRNELVIEHVKKSGENGITQQELEQLLNGCPNLRRNLRRCEAKGIIVSIVEVQGRLRRYRYFDPEGLRKYQQTQNVDNMANNADPSINSTNSNNSSSNDMDGRYLQERKRPIEDGDQTVGDKRASKKQRTVEEKKTLGKRKRSDNVRENEDDAGNTNSDKFVRQQRTGMKASGSVMTQAARRKKALASIISRDKVREANDELAAEVSRAASDSSDAPNMARATLIKFAESLHLSGEIVVVRTMIPNLIGVPESKVLFLRPDISKDDQLVQQCLEHSRMSFAVKQQSNKRQVPEIHADLPPQRQQSASQDVVRLAPGLYWHELALRHGWIQSKFLRARALHEFLWESFHQEQLRRFNLAQVLINMPLSLYCRIIGIAFYSEAVEEFMQNNDQDMTLSQMPTDIRAKMVKRIHRLRNSLRTLIDILMALELLVLVDEDPKNGGLYQLSDVGKVKNYSSKERPLLQEFRLQTQQDVGSFWKELQYVCMYMPSRQSDLAECGVNDALYAITLPRSWDSGSLLTIEQRKILDSHADKTQGKVPLDDSRLISSLARELGISTHRVRRYYEVIVEAYEKRKGKTIRLRKRVPARNGRASSTALRSGQSDAQDAGEENSEGQKTPISTRKFSEHSRRRDTETWTRKNGQGPPWTETEISILLHAYAIMRHRSRGNARNVNWALLHSLFPKRSRRACKHCLYSLRWTRPATHQQLEELKAEWAQIYEQGIASGEIVDERPWDTENFDFYGHLEYFMRIMREKPEACTRTVALPAHVDEVKYGYQAPSSRQEQVLIGVRSMTVDRIQDILMDEQFLLVTTIIKMIVLSPKDEYTSEAGYSLLRPFNAELITRAISYLRKMGVLMRSKLRLDSRLPGRRFYVAQRFEKNLNEGTIPFKTFQEANHFATNVSSSATLDYSVTGGGMMALLSMLSEGRICLDMKNSEEYLKIRQTNFYPRLGHESLQNQWIDHGFQLMATKSIGDNPRPIDETTLSSCPQPRREDVQLNTREQAENLLSDQTEHILYCEIRECKENGMTHCQIKERACKLGIHDEEIVAQTLSSLLDSSTVLKVGLSAERYVASEFAGPWLARAMKPSSEGIVEYYKPRMWCDVHGNTMTDILQKCGKMLLADIMDYPGISLNKLCINYEGQMTRGEVVDLLERAEKVGVVKSQRLKPKAFASQTSWFTKPSSRIVTDEIYCYWPGKSCYSKLFDLQ